MKKPVKPKKRSLIPAKFANIVYEIYSNHSNNVNIPKYLLIPEKEEEDAIKDFLQKHNISFSEEDWHDQFTDLEYYNVYGLDEVDRQLIEFLLKTIDGDFRFIDVGYDNAVQILVNKEYSTEEHAKLIAEWENQERNYEKNLLKYQSDLELYKQYQKKQKLVRLKKAVSELEEGIN